jgi:HK97 family phage portal protein
MKLINKIFNNNTNNKLEMKSAFSNNDFTLSAGSSGDFESNKFSFASLAYEAYCNNVIANRCVNLIASNVSQVKFEIIKGDKRGRVTNLLANPNIDSCFAEIISQLVSYYLIAGEAYLLAIRGINNEIAGLQIIRPNLVQIKRNSRMLKTAYVIEGQTPINIKINPLNGSSDLFVFKSFNPLSDDNGISQIEAAITSIMQHNLASKWNQSLLKNSARPSGILTIKNGTFLTDAQFKNLKEQVDYCFSGAKNSGRPILLEGGMEWKDTGLSPKDMDFLESKNMAAREIALALGVPPQLLGIPGDNKFSNYSEARKSFWQETINPLAIQLAAKLSTWFSLLLAENIKIEAIERSDV